ncbi:hypothetical protein BSKO_03485 [Bryopsis sp. KO-2023]|nr:hypothetical protein BSKO_03485 [Bryopsis sp. KO-2023]
MLLARLFSRPAVTCGDIHRERFNQGLASFRSAPSLRGGILSATTPLPFRRASVVCQANPKPKSTSKAKAKTKADTKTAAKKRVKKKVDGRKSGGGEGLKQPVTKSSLMKLTKARLVEELESHKCETIGKKQDLVDRLYNAINGIEDTKDPLSGLSFSMLMAKKKNFLEEACKKRGIKKKCKTKEDMVTALLEFFEKTADIKDEGVIRASAPAIADKPTEQELLGLTVVELRAICDERGLPCAGKKALLVGRILASFEPEKGLDLQYLHTCTSDMGEEGLKAMTKAEMLEMFEPSGLSFEGLTKPQMIKEINRGFVLAVEKMEKQKQSEGEAKEIENFVEKVDIDLEPRILDEDEQLDEAFSEYVETEEPPIGKALVGNVDQIIDDLVTEVYRVYGQYLVDEDSENELDTEPSYIMEDDDDDDESDVWDALLDEDVISDVDVRERLAQRRSISKGRFRTSGGPVSGDFREPTPEELLALESEAALHDAAFKPGIEDFAADFDDIDAGDDLGGEKDDRNEVAMGKAFQEVPDIQDDEGIDVGGFDTQSRKQLFQGGSLKEGDTDEDNDDDIISTGRRSRKRGRENAPTAAAIDFDNVLSDMEAAAPDEPDEELLNRPIDTSLFMEEDEDDEVPDAGSSLLEMKGVEDVIESRKGPTFPPGIDLFNESDQKEDSNVASSAANAPEVVDTKEAQGLEYEELDFGDDDDIISGEKDSEIQGVMELGEFIDQKPVEIDVEAVVVEEETAELDEGPFPETVESKSDPTTEGGSAEVHEPVASSETGEMEESGDEKPMVESQESPGKGKKEESTVAEFDDKEPADSESDDSTSRVGSSVADSEESNGAVHEETEDKEIPSASASDKVEGDPVQEAATAPDAGKAPAPDPELIAEQDEMEDGPASLPEAGSSSDHSEEEPAVAGPTQSEIDVPPVLDRQVKENRGVGVLDDSTGADVEVPILRKAGSSGSNGRRSQGRNVEILEEEEGEEEEEEGYATVDEIKQKVEDQKVALRKVREETEKRKNAISEIKARIEASDKKQRLSVTQMKRLLEVTENIKAQRKSWQVSMETKMETLKADADKTVKNRDLKVKLESSIKELEGEFQTLQDQVKKRNREADALRESINRAIQEYGLLPPSPGFPPIGSGDGEFGPLVSFPGISGSSSPTGIFATSDQNNNVNGVLRDFDVNPASIAPISYDFALPPTVGNGDLGDNGDLLPGLDRGEKKLEKAAENEVVEEPGSGSEPRSKKSEDRIQDKSPIVAVAALGLGFLEASGLSKLFGGNDKKKG